MKEEVLNTIEVLQFKIEQLEAEYNLNISTNAPANSLNVISRNIKRLNERLLALKFQLLDELPSKKKLFS
jgi:hypothetical protein